MKRSLAALATMTLVVLGLPAVADAGMFVPLLGQSANFQRGPGFYLDLIKFVPVLLVFLLWARTTYWVDDDMRDLNNVRHAMWNSLVFFVPLLGFLLVWVIPIYLIGLLLLLICYFAPLLTYIYVRNQTVPDDEKVLTSYHLGEVMNGLIGNMGMRPMFNRGDSGAASAGPPVTFVPKGSGKLDPEKIAKAHESEFIVSAKELVYDAVLRRSTDIHLEPTAEQLAIRYRIDGILHAAEPFDRPTGDAIINIFKVIAAMDISEKRKPQDGSFGAKLEGRDIDFRVATSGSKAGEKMVIRILDNASSIAKIDEIGMRPKMAAEIKQLVTQPHGMFLCCGPTGSGKSTTLYACLREIDRFQKNIITVEDPIEYQIDNVTQMEINTKAGQSFATSLKSILRQDPDVLMVGEIRDSETATMACQAATTGHMVFSTIHANDSVTALFRLLDLGVEPFMASSALTAILSQRLVRLLCENCKEPYKPKPEFLKKANLPADKVDVFYRKPADPEQPQQICTVCGGTGYIGRTGIFELLVLTEPIKEILRENPSPNAIKAEARKNGMIYLQEDGLRQVIQGKTAIDELLRVVK